MKKYYLVLAVLFVGFYLAFLGSTHFISAQETSEGAAAKETVILESSMGNVTLSHQKHTTLTECAECHHNGMDNPKCSNCHTKDSTVNAMTAYHKNCIDCHKEKTAGPVACADCHKK